MNKRIFTVIKWAVALFAFVFVFMQIYNSVVKTVTTDTVYEYSAYSGYDTVGYIIRNETVIVSNTAGSMGYDVEDGGRVAKGGVIAEIYSNESDAANREKAEKLDRQIKRLEEIQVYNDLTSVDINALSGKIHNNLIESARNTQSGRVEMAESFDDLLAGINRMQIVTGTVSDFAPLIASLKAERDAYKAEKSKSLGTLTSPVSGYVIYSVDGYENSLTVNDISSLTADRLDGIEPAAVQSGSVCKIVSDYEWYIAVKLPFSQSLNLKEGQTVKLRTSLLSAPEIKATVKHINKESVGNDAAVVFSCNTMNTELAATRYIDVTVVYNEYSGLKVDNRAVRYVDGVRGVFVLTASQVKFVPVNVLWQGDNYSIVEKKASDQKVLRVYDEIIVKGKNMYDGKIIDNR